MNQVYTWDVDSSFIDFVKSGNAESDWIVPVWWTCRKYAFLLTFKFRWFDFGLSIVVFIQTNVEDEDYPYVAEVFKAFKARRIDLVDKG